MVYIIYIMRNSFFCLLTSGLRWCVSDADATVYSHGSQVSNKNVLSELLMSEIKANNLDVLFFKLFHSLLSCSVLNISR